MNWLQGAKLIPLTQGKFAIVDEEDYERLSRYTWHAQKHRRTYQTEIEAACAYDRAALKYFGEFVCTNFPRKDYENGLEPNVQVAS